MERFAGIDWASAEHALCVVDGAGGRLREQLVAHDGDGITALCRELVGPGVGRVAIERPDGLLVDRLLETGIEVIAVHPDQAKAARDRYSVAHDTLVRLARPDG